MLQYPTMISILILFFSVSIITSLLCSLWESVLLSITPSYVQRQLKSGSRLGKRLAAFKDNIDQPLAAILTLNTIAHTIGAIGVGQQASLIWADSAPIITKIVVPVGMTIAILILSEIIPKTIGAVNWKALTPFTITSLSVVTKSLWPLVWACQIITSTLNSGKDKNVFSRNDLLAMTQIGAQEGKINNTEALFIENVLKLKSVKLKDIMTPRTVISMAPETITVAEFYEQNPNIPFSRIPLHDHNNPDDITGFVLKVDILNHLEQGKGDSQLSELRRDIPMQPDTQSALVQFTNSIKKREHISLVVNEHGVPVGIVSLEDLIEELVGQEIVDETDEVADMQAHAKSV